MTATMVMRSSLRAMTERDPRPAGPSTLTPREMDVLAAMADGKANTAISEALFISRRAVEKHINSIFAKLGLTADGDDHPRVRAVLVYLSERGAVRATAAGPPSTHPAPARAHHRSAGRAPAAPCRCRR